MIDLEEIAVCIMHYIMEPENSPQNSHLFHWSTKFTFFLSHEPQ